MILSLVGGQADQSPEPPSGRRKLAIVRSADVRPIRTTLHPGSGTETAPTDGSGTSSIAAAADAAADATAAAAAAHGDTRGTQIPRVASTGLQPMSTHHDI